MKNLMAFLPKCGLLLLLCLVVEIAHAILPAPTPLCTRVQANNAVIFSWDPVAADPLGEFVAYHVEYSIDAAGPWTEVAVLPNIAMAEFTHAPTLANTQQVFYRIYTEANSGNSTPQAPIGTIHLENSLGLFSGGDPILQTGKVDFEWTNPFVVSTAPSPSFYQLSYTLNGITSDIGFFNFDLFNSDNGTLEEWAYENIDGANCTDVTLTFQVFVETMAGCRFESNFGSGIYSDNTAPEVPFITSISYTDANDLVFDWNLSGGDTQGYFIRNCTGNPGETGITGIGLVTTAPSVIPDVYLGPNQGFGFTVASVDECGNLSATNSDCHYPVILTSSYEDCDDFIHLEWTPYIGWDDIPRYTVYASVGGTGFNPVATIEPGFPLEHDFMIDGDTPLYDFYVFAGEPNLPSISTQSNTVQQVVNFTASPDPFYLSSVSANGQQMEATFMTEPLPNLEFVLERFEPVLGLWIELTDAPTVDFNVGPSVLITTIADREADPAFGPYTYRIKAIDICGKELGFSNEGVSIFLDGLANNNELTNTLNWTETTWMEGGLDSYFVVRSKDGVPDGPEIAMTPENQRYWQEDVSDKLEESGEFCYMVGAQEAANTIVGINAKMYSNEICLLQEPLIWIPTAFVINGNNDKFFPIISLANIQRYSLNIYNRWGQEIFNTTNIDEGWDGRINKKFAQEGAYIYKMSVEDGAGEVRERQGWVTLLKQRVQ